MIDCFRILAELQAAGLNNKEVARRLGKPVTTVEYWKEGHIPRFDNACQLLSLYAQVVRPPEIRVFFSTTVYKVVVTPAI